MKYISIAIDGPAGAGKSTMARALAQALGFVYVDTGAIYRAVGYHMSLMGIGPRDRDGITRLISDVNVELRYDEQGVQHTFLNGVDVSDEIRSPEMSMIASTISAHKVVRDYLLEVQRQVARTHNTVMDGRDIGTVVLPRANVKIFLTASDRCRAKRRCRQLEQAGKQADYSEILQQIRQRDEQDMNRAVAPLRCAPDAVRVDSSELTAEQTLQQLLDTVRERIG